MTPRVQLVRLSVRNVGTLRGERIELGPFGPGVNVIHGGNETGKSTLVEALRAALFERHSAGHAGIRALQPHGTKDAPEIWVEMRLGETPLHLHKRFLKREMVELRIGEDGLVLTGDDAESRLQDLLEAQPAGNKGATKDTMGVWGLLWVRQDGEAASEPAKVIGTHVKATLSAAIEQQVGQIMGGRRGVELHDSVLEEFRRYFTETTRKPSGEYRIAQQRCEQADALVKQIRANKTATEQLAAEIDALTEQRMHAARERERLVKEHQHAIDATTRVDALRASVHSAEQAVSIAEGNATRARDRQEERRARIEDLRRLEADLVRRTRTLEIAERQLQELDARSIEAANRLATHTEEHDRARAELESTSRTLELCRQQERLEALERDLAEVTPLIEQATADETSLQRLITVEGMERLRTLDGRIRQISDRLAREATRLVVELPDGTQRVHPVESRTTVTDPGLGTIDIEPARSGFGAAARAVQEGRMQLREALLSAGVETLTHARALREQRRGPEQQIVALQSELAVLAPKGVDALAREEQRLVAELAAADPRLKRALEHDSEVQQLLQLLGGNPFDTACMKDLRSLLGERERLRERTRAVATVVTVTALDAVAVAVGHNESAQGLARGQRAVHQVSHATRLTIDDRVAIDIEPRSESLASDLASLDRCTFRIETLLKDGAAGTPDDAEQRATERSQQEARLEQLRSALVADAPSGVSALREQVRGLRAQLPEISARLRGVRDREVRIREIETLLASNRMTEATFEQLGSLDEALFRAEAEAARLAPRLKAVQGPILDTLGTQVIPWLTQEPLDIDGVRAWVVPGEIVAGADRAVEIERMRAALAEWSVDSIETAEAQYAERIERTARLEGAVWRIARLAPEGQAALESRCQEIRAWIGATGAAPGTTASTEAELVARAELQKRAVLASEVTRNESRLYSEQCSAARDVQRSVVQNERGALDVAQSTVLVRRSELDVLRMNDPDEAIEAAFQKAEADRIAASRALDDARADLARAEPQLLQDEVRRADGALQSCSARVDAITRALIEKETLLRKAGAEGHFDALGDAEEELEVARDELARIERRARAAALLMREVERAYEDAQRRLMGPVYSEAQPYLRNLRPGTTLQMNSELELEKVVHNGVDESFDRLSGGTREQLAVIVRIALAKVFSRNRRALPLILDDVLGWTDDARFVKMVQILRGASQEMQVILLTCQPMRFARFQGATEFDLDALKRLASASAGESAGGAGA